MFDGTCWQMFTEEIGRQSRYNVVQIEVSFAFVEPSTLLES